MENRKRILGLDLGTNSIGWAVVNGRTDENGQIIADGIEDAGSRIIPMDNQELSNFDQGNIKSKASERTGYRGTRRMFERSKQRRERLHRVLSVLGFLPKHYADCLTRYGKFKTDVECKLPWSKDAEGKAVFLFRQSYEEMLQAFRNQHPEMMQQNMKVPYDWTLYYLRSKALEQPISPEELAWILLNFNQKRGYYQTRAEQEEETDKKDKSKKEEYVVAKVIDVIDTHEKSGKKTWFDVVLDNGLTYHRPDLEAPDWIGKEKEFIVTTHFETDGTPKKDKDGRIKQSFRLPKEEDWSLLKLKTQADIDRSQLTVGAYIFNALLNNPKQKIKGKLVRVIERDFYKDELKKILEIQKQFIQQLRSKELYDDCIAVLYPQNEAYRNSIASHDFTYLFVDDILFHQRPLKSKKSLIADCPYEYHEYRDKEDGLVKRKYVKCIAKSHPLFQEFRLWQFVSNLKLYELCTDINGRQLEDKDVTSQSLPDEESRAQLFDYLNNQTSVKQDALLTKYFNIKKPKGKDSVMPYRWNYVQDREYPCNETRGSILGRLNKAHVNTDFLTSEAELALWQILYSINDKTELRKALNKYAQHHQLGSEFVEAMESFPPFSSDYGSYSAKAIKKLLPLMRMGHHWNSGNIDASTLERIHKIIDGEVDETIPERVREKTIAMNDVCDFRAMPLWLACYVVYNRHSEAQNTDRWTSPEDIDRFLSEFKQHSLRNPVVEMVVTETLRVVRDIWKTYGAMDEIHVEMGREMKNPADKRKQITAKALENEKANLRVKALLTEFLNPELGIEAVRPYSPSQQELLRIYEETVLNSVDEIDDDIKDIMTRLAQTDIYKKPTHGEILRYKLWLDQKYVSPYTAESIPLSRLFTSDYEIEHVIPQSRYFDDSLTNKVICEAAVNKLKDNALGYEFIKKHHGEKVVLGNGKTVSILDEVSYCSHVQRTYKNNRAKMNKLLLEDIPANFIERQLNDSRYISKLIKGLLSNMVREEGEQEATSKNVVVCTGSVTDRLKRDWGVNDVWNRIILPRFQRMNELTGTQKFTTTNTSGHLIPDMPLELQQGFSKKRIDHRHHAMDAIVIACTTRSHVNLISNEAALPKNNANRYQLSKKLRRYEEQIVERNGETKRIFVAKEFSLPWQSFPADVHRVLLHTIVSFKQNLRVIAKTNNHFLRFVDGKKKMVKQTKGDSWAIRKPMHKETYYGEINLRGIKSVALKEAIKMPERIVKTELKEKIKAMVALGYNEKKMKSYFVENQEVWSDVNLKKIEVYYFSKETSDRYFASRKAIDESFNEKKIKNEVADTAIQKILLNQLKKYANNAKEAFSPEGLEDMNRHIADLNGGRNHQPVYKVRVYEKGEKFAVGQTGNKKQKFVEAAKGTNLFFAVCEKEEFNKQTNKLEKKRDYRTIPLNVAVEKLKNNEAIDESATFILSPGDLVYLPTQKDIEAGTVQQIDQSRIYKMVSSNKSQGFFVLQSVASVIQDKVEFSSQNKMERAITGEMIKEICIPVKVDRLGHIIKVGFRTL